MQHLTIEGQNLVNDISSRYQLSQDAVIHMLIAVNNGGGSMAQFNCPELGGSGQWMRGGMTMVGDMFNHGLKNTVDNLCNELSNALAAIQVFPPVSSSFSSANQWWPQELGSPFSSGAQNDIRYAVFPQRLAIERNGKITVYDTLDHQIGGVSQQQGGDTSLTFSSQYGTIAVSSLPIVSGPGVQVEPQTNFATQPETETTAQGFQNPPVNDSMADIPATGAEASASDEILNLIEKLARLRDNGVISDEEFNTKKSELLSRL